MTICHLLDKTVPQHSSGPVDKGRGHSIVWAGLMTLDGSANRTVYSFKLTRHHFVDNLDSVTPNANDRDYEMFRP